MEEVRRGLDIRALLLGENRSVYFKDPREVGLAFFEDAYSPLLPRLVPPARLALVLLDPQVARQPQSRLHQTCAGAIQADRFRQDS